MRIFTKRMISILYINIQYIFYIFLNYILIYT